MQAVAWKTDKMLWTGSELIKRLNVYEHGGDHIFSIPHHELAYTAQYAEYNIQEHPILLLTHETYLGDLSTNMDKHLIRQAIETASQDCTNTEKNKTDFHEWICDSREMVIDNIKEVTANVVLVDGLIHIKTREPVYIVRYSGEGQGRVFVSIYSELESDTLAPNTASFNANSYTSALEFASKKANEIGENCTRSLSTPRNRPSVYMPNVITSTNKTEAEITK